MARDLDLTETAMREWIKLTEPDEGMRADGPSTADRPEMADLRQELRGVR